MRIEIREIQTRDYSGDMATMTQMQREEAKWQFPLQPDLARCQAMLDSGVLFWFGAFDGDRMIGYSTAYVVPHDYNPEILCTFSQALFVLPAYRKSSAAFKLMRATEAKGKALGARLIYWNLVAGTDLPKALAKRGYREADIVMEKEL